jgi:hypothetical protein
MRPLLNPLSAALFAAAILLVAVASCGALSRSGEQEGFAQETSAQETSARGAYAQETNAQETNAPEINARNDGRQDECRAGPPKGTSGNCRPLCRGQALEWDRGGASTAVVKGCKESEQSDEYMLCRSRDTCDHGPWYKTSIAAEDRPAPSRREPHGGVSPEPSISPPGDASVPGHSPRDSWKGDPEYPSDPTFRGGTHHHYYEGSEHRRWRQEVMPASPHLPTTAHGAAGLGRHMSPASHEHDACPRSVTGEFGECGPAAANIPCYELFR